MAIWSVCLGQIVYFSLLEFSMEPIHNSMQNQGNNHLSISRNIDAHIDFAEKLVSKYKGKWHNAVYSELCGKLEKIKYKQEHGKLNISVVGDFSSGKSTFINALLRCNLLKEGVLQGTTTALTVLEYYPEYVLIVEDKYKRVKTHKYNTFKELSTDLHKFTTNRGAKDLNFVRVGLPASVLNSNIRIIDTPGINALEVWHEEVTRRAIKKYSDISIVVVDATQALPETFCTFITKNLSDILTKCVFLVTKYDKVEKDERTTILKFIDLKLQSSFNLSNAIILPYSSLNILKAFVSNIDKKLCNSELVQTSITSERILMLHASKIRSLVRTRKTMNYIYSVYNDILYHLKQLYDDLKNRPNNIRNMTYWRTEASIDYRTDGIKDDIKALVNKQNSIKLMLQLYARN